jgi:predicted deacylase
MRKILLFLAILAFTPAAHAQKGWRDHEMEIRVQFHSADEAARLHDLHLNGDVYGTAGSAVLFVIPSELEAVKQAGFQAVILKSDLNEYYGDFWSLRADQYHSYEQIIALMDSLATAFPGICQKTVLGLTPQGRQIACLKISDSVSVTENEPEVLFDGGIHGDEIGGPENLIRFARYLCTAYGNDPEITGLVNTREITIYPMVNPDGRANMSRYNSNFVDCNRDWGYMWNGEGSSPSAFSQPETRAIRDLLYGRRFVIHVTYHSGEEVVLYPWCYRSSHPRDFSSLQQLAVIYSDSSGYPNLQYRQSWADYPTNGETIDYSYGADGTDALTMEISNNKQPSASQIQYYYQANVPSMLAMIRNAGYGIEGMVTDSLTGLPVRAAIFAGTLFPVYSDSVLGDYHKFAIPGTYPVKVVANGYLTKVISSVNVTALSSTVVNVTMQPAAGHYATKVSAVAIPGNNPMDEANTPAIIGKPDSLNYSTGKGGWIIVDMQEPVNDIPGGDFTVYEGDQTPEGFTCYAGQTMDGPWVSLGSGTGTTSFDLGSAGLSGARFIRILDDGDGQQNLANAGFDLDAIESLEQPTGVNATNKNSDLLNVYPNPAHEVITIELLGTHAKGILKIYNLQGADLITEQLTGRPLQISIRNLPKGVYLVKFTNEDTSGVIKLIKE